MNTITAGEKEYTNVEDTSLRRPLSVWLLIVLQVFVAMGAFLGGGAFILAPDGHLIQMPFSHLKNSPFSSFLIPGILLFTFLGVYPVAVAYGLWKRPAWRWPDIINPFKRMHWSWAGSLAAGVIVIIWITVEILWVPFGLVHILFYVWGAALLLLTLLPDVRRYYTRNPGIASFSYTTNNGEELMKKSRIIIRSVLVIASWSLFILLALLTGLLAGWVLLAEVLLGGLTSLQPIPVIPILGVLIVMTGGLAWLVARYVASPRSVGLAIGLIYSLLLVIGGVWALSSPDQAIFLARDIAWDGTDVWQVQKFPERAISNAPPAFYFEQSLSPQMFQTITYRQEAQLKQASLDELLQITQATSFIIIKDGAILYEGYFNGYTRDSIVTSFSIAKSVTSALVGIAIDEGYISSVNDPIIYYLPELRGKGLDGITIRHLLTMSTGIRYVHGDELPPLLRPLPFNDDSWTTDYPDLRSLAVSVKADGETPGSAWKYNNYYPQLLGLILERTTHRTVSEYLQEKIWQPLGMEYPASWSLDSKESGFEKMEQGINARATDFAKVGQLFLNKGNWNGKQIIPQQWVIDSTSPDPNDNRPWRVSDDWKEKDGYYKYMWWGESRIDGSYVYLARGGMNQQWIYVSPQDQVVIVRFGLSDDGGGVWWPDIFESLVADLK